MHEHDLDRRALLIIVGRLNGEPQTDAKTGHGHSAEERRQDFRKAHEAGWVGEKGEHAAWLTVFF